LIEENQAVTFILDIGGFGLNAGINQQSILPPALTKIICERIIEGRF
jgi:hypothetical protein